jgi:hypothetical protein
MSLTQNAANKDEMALDIRTNTDQLLDLTRAMLAAAEADDWDKFGLQEQQRRVLLEMVFGSQTIEESTKLHLTNVISEIQLTDKTITRLIIQQRDLAAEELRHLRHAQEGNKAYRIAADDL